MTVRVIGAGLGRTGTHSLKLALERLLGGPCYHMFEALDHPEDFAVWQRAAEGQMPDWASFLARYEATVDWPAAAFWAELAAAFPDAVVLLSTRPTNEWWASASRTIWEVSGRPADGAPEPFGSQLRMIQTLLPARFTPDWRVEGPSCAAYERHNEHVRASVDPARLVEWHPGDGWAPICRALGIAVPDEPFPHVNTTDDFRALVGLA